MAHRRSDEHRPDAEQESDRARATVATQLRLGSGFAAAERPDILERLASLDPALAAFGASTVELELSMKDRERHGQATTLQCWIAGWPRLVATSSRPAFVSSLVEVRDDLRRQLDDAKDRATPMTRPPAARSRPADRRSS